MIRKIVVSLSMIVLSLGKVWAQGCSVCTSTASQMGEESGKGLNLGIVYLAMLPLTFIGVLGFIWWKKNHKANS